MDLLYLWIDNFASINKEGFNLSAQFDFNIESTYKGGSPISYQLTISLNKDYCDIFPAPIRNVTGIVGMNGSGKSSLLNCIKVLSGQAGMMITSTIMCFLDPETKEIFTYYYSGGKMSILPLSLTLITEGDVAEKFKVSAPRPYQLIGDYTMKGNRVDGMHFDLKSLNCTYITNILSQHKEEIYDGILNLSTSALLTQVLDKVVTDEIRQSKDESKIPTLRLYPTHLTDFRKEELKDWVRFLAFANQSRYELPDFIPQLITIDFHFNDTDLKDENTYKLAAYRSRAKELLTIVIEYTNKHYQGQHKTRFMVLAYTSVLFYFMKEVSYSSNPKLYKILNSVLDNLGSSTNDLYQRLSGALTPLYDAIIDTEMAQRIQPLMKGNLERAVDWINFEDKSVTNGSFYQYHLPITAGLWRLLSLIFDLEQTTEADILSFRFEHDLSSGEEAMLHNCAKLMRAKRKWRGKPFLLLLDEGESNYHPEWQRNYFKNLMDVIKILFAAGQVQLILTTHSPFIVSDLPKSNMLFLEKTNKRTKVVDRQHHPETFAGNIHELYTDSFFLANNLVGAYATQLIKDMIAEIHEIKDGELDLAIYRQKFEKQINMIGEPFLKRTLLDMVSQKADFETVDDIVSAKEAELEELKRKRNSKRQ